MKATPLHVFTYGSLMCPDIMAKVSGFTKPGIAARLEGFFRSRVKGEEYPAIAPQPEAFVEGILYSDVPAKGLELLDLFEGETYERRTVSVRDAAENSYQAEVYVFRREFHHLLVHAEWDFEVFLAQGKKKFEQDYKGFAAI